MNPSILGGAAVAVLLWLLVRRRRAAVILRSTDTGAIAALNRAQIELVQEPVPADPSADAAPPEQELLPPLPAPADRAGRQRLLRQLQADLACSEPGRRRQALRQARLWGHRSTLPLLRLGLRDVDPAVVREAAEAMARFRGRTLPSPAPGFQRTLPRNVARTR